MVDLNVVVSILSNLFPHMWQVTYNQNSSGASEYGWLPAFYSFVIVVREICLILVLCAGLTVTVGAYLKSTGRSAQVQMYTRTGSFKAKHLEYRLVIWFSLVLCLTICFITDVLLKIVGKDSFMGSVLKEGRFITILTVWRNHFSSPSVNLAFQWIFYTSFHWILCTFRQRMCCLWIKYAFLGHFLQVFSFGRAVQGPPSEWIWWCISWE